MKPAGDGNSQTDVTRRASMGSQHLAISVSNSFADVTAQLKNAAAAVAAAASNLADTIEVLRYGSTAEDEMRALSARLTEAEMVGAERVKSQQPEFYFSMQTNASGAYLVAQDSASNKKYLVTEESLIYKNGSTTFTVDTATIFTDLENNRIAFAMLDGQKIERIDISKVGDTFVPPPVPSRARR